MKISKIGKCYQSTTTKQLFFSKFLFQRSESVISPQQFLMDGSLPANFKDRKVLSVHNKPADHKAITIISKIGKCYQSTTQPEDVMNEQGFQRSESVISPQQGRHCESVDDYFKDRKVLSVHNGNCYCIKQCRISKIGKCYQSTTSE